MRRGALLVGVIAGLALATAPLGVAGSGSVSDPRGDMDPTGATNPSGRYDIVRATFGHSSSGRLVHTVTVNGDIQNPASAEVPLLLIEDFTQPNNMSDCRYFVGRHGGKLGVFTCGYAERVASARIRRTSSSTVRYEFTPKAIGNPASYKWAFVTRGPTDGTTSYLDRLPDGDHAFATHTLH